LNLMILWTVVIFLAACNLPAASTPPPDLLSTLAASTPLSADSPLQPAIPVSPDGEPFGKIAFTCQVFRVTATNQICIINADGTAFRRLTTDNTKQHYYPSVAPDGRSVVYAAFREPNIYEIYEIEIDSGSVKQLTDRLGNVNGPEISPDGQSIVFKLSTPTSNEIWLMDRDGNNQHRIPNAFRLGPDLVAGWTIYFVRIGCAGRGAVIQHPYGWKRIKKDQQPARDTGQKRLVSRWAVHRHLFRSAVESGCLHHEC
jgi:hypothetical protein